jgi:hypothetical protein
MQNWIDLGGHQENLDADLELARKLQGTIENNIFTLIYLVIPALSRT